MGHLGTRLKDKLAVVVGGGQTPGETIGNGRATALRFAQEGATVIVLDIRLASAQETVSMILAELGRETGADVGSDANDNLPRATAYELDVTDETACQSEGLPLGSANRL